MKNKKEYSEARKWDIYERRANRLDNCFLFYLMKLRVQYPLPAGMCVTDLVDEFYNVCLTTVLFDFKIHTIDRKPIYQERNIFPYTIIFVFIRSGKVANPLTEFNCCYWDQVCMQRNLKGHFVSITEIHSKDL